jgi:acyl-CoA thioesterase I
MYTRILIFGDSIAWGAWDEKGGWANRIKKFVDKKLIIDPAYDSSVYILGISGDTTDDLLKRFKNEVTARIDKDNPMCIVFAIGINDPQLNNQTHTNKVHPDKFRKNLIELINKARKYGNHLAFVGLCPVIEEKANSRPGKTHKSYLLHEAEEYNEILKQVSKQNHVDFIDIYDEFLKSDLNELLPDGLHPNSRGHELIYGIVLKYLKDKNWI